MDDLDRPLPAGETGEIVVRGPMVFKGYWNCAAVNELTFRGGWHHSGDLGRLDEAGVLWYAGRSPAKELIKPGGENVYPAEVEKVFMEHPAVVEAAVIGVPDAQWGEAIKAICVCRPDQPVTAEALIEFVGGRIARFKKPKHVTFVPALPKTPAGAIDRPKVKEAHGQPTSVDLDLAGGPGGTVPRDIADQRRPHGHVDVDRPGQAPRSAPASRSTERMRRSTRAQEWPMTIRRRLECTSVVRRTSRAREPSAKGTR